MSTHVLARWEPENPGFWKQTGARIANRNLWISIPALMLAFSIWMLWSVVVVTWTAPASCCPRTSCSG